MVLIGRVNRYFNRVRGVESSQVASPEIPTEMRRFSRYSCTSDRSKCRAHPQEPAYQQTAGGERMC